MTDMTNSMKSWNERQKRLGTIILDESLFDEARNLMITQHALVHPKEMTKLDVPTFEDELWDSMTEDDFRRIPSRSIYSIAWHLWHCARIEDIVVSFFINPKQQVFESGRFDKSLGTDFIDTGNSMNIDEMKVLSRDLSMTALKKYRIAVGKNTIAAFKTLSPEKLRMKVSGDAIKEIESLGFVVKDSQWLLDFWGQKKIAGLITMPLTRHLMVHINESKRLVGKKGR